MLIRLMDGQHSLWGTAETCCEVPAEYVVDILDVVHVSSYVWKAAKVFHSHHEHQEAFARERLLRILQGDLKSVIAGLRRMASLRGLHGEQRKEIDTVCGYFEAHAGRMRYDEYLAAGYPIATGVIEGACRHLVKDRMERSGMRWTLEGAQAMLNLRALRQSLMIDKWIVTSWEEVGLALLSLVVALGAILLMTRASGLRSFAKMSASDFVITVALGSLLAGAATTSSPPLLQSLAVIVGVFALHVGSIEALHLLEATLPTTRFLCSAVMTASATVLALMLTMLSFGITTERELNRVIYHRLKQIALYDTLIFIAASCFLVMHCVPLRESDQMPTGWYAIVYYVVLCTASIVAGGVVTVVAMLYAAIRDLIQVLGLRDDEHVLATNSEDGSPAPAEE
eukprot:g26650.t1